MKTQAKQKASIGLGIASLVLGLAAFLLSPSVTFFPLNYICTELVDCWDAYSGGWPVIGWMFTIGAVTFFISIVLTTAAVIYTKWRNFFALGGFFLMILALISFILFIIVWVGSSGFT